MEEMQQHLNFFEMRLQEKLSFMLEHNRILRDLSAARQGVGISSVCAPPYLSLIKAHATLLLVVLPFPPAP